jgi:hypothetical protein
VRAGAVAGRGRVGRLIAAASIRPSAALCRLQALAPTPASALLPSQDGAAASSSSASSSVLSSSLGDEPGWSDADEGTAGCCTVRKGITASSRLARPQAEDAPPAPAPRAPAAAARAPLPPPAAPTSASSSMEGSDSALKTAACRSCCAAKAPPSAGAACEHRERHGNGASASEQPLEELVARGEPGCG